MPRFAAYRLSIQVSTAFSMHACSVSHSFLSSYFLSAKSSTKNSLTMSTTVIATPVRPNATARLRNSVNQSKTPIEPLATKEMRSVYAYL